jgi:hypothetical protein
MLLLLTAMAPARAQDCPKVADQVAEALEALDQAEIEAARQRVAQGYGALSCQTEVVDTETLLELYRVDGLIALAQSDPKGMVYATLRAVAASHDAGRPPDRYGPELQASFDKWAERLQQDLVTVTVADGGAAWVDGRPVDAAHPLQVIEGEHLLQTVDAGGRFSSRVEEIAGDYVMTTGIPLQGQSVPISKPLPDPVPLEPKPLVMRKRPPALVIGTIASAGIAGIALVSGFRTEGLLHASSYDDPRYGGCSQAQRCWALNRELAIRQDARLANRLYATGYAAAGITGGLLVVTLIGFPGETAGAR